MPWGWDRAHTDSPRPYTLDELNVREECPHVYAYPLHAEYVKGFHLWRALRRDGRLTNAEAEARFAVLEEELMARRDR